MRKCKRHPKSQGKRPKGNCRTCWEIYWLKHPPTTWRGLREEREAA